MLAQAVNSRDPTILKSYPPILIRARNRGVLGLAHFAERPAGADAHQTLPESLTCLDQGLASSSGRASSPRVRQITARLAVGLLAINRLFGERLDGLSLSRSVIVISTGASRAWNRRGTARSGSSGSSVCSGAHGPPSASLRARSGSWKVARATACMQLCVIEFMPDSEPARLRCKWPSALRGSPISSATWPRLKSTNGSSGAREPLGFECGSAGLRSSFLRRKPLARCIPRGGRPRRSTAPVPQPGARRARSARGRDTPSARRRGAERAGRGRQPCRRPRSRPGRRRTGPRTPHWSSQARRRGIEAGRAGAARGGRRRRARRHSRRSRESPGRSCGPRRSRRPTGKSKTRAPNERATSTVRSDDPVSTTTTSSNRSAAEARQAGRLSSSSRTIKFRLTRQRRLQGSSPDCRPTGRGGIARQMDDQVERHGQLETRPAGPLRQGVEGVRSLDCSSRPLDRLEDPPLDQHARSSRASGRLEPFSSCCYASLPRTGGWLSRSAFR